MGPVECIRPTVALKLRSLRKTKSPPPAAPPRSKDPALLRELHRETPGSRDLEVKVVPAPAMTGDLLATFLREVPAMRPVLTVPASDQNRLRMKCCEHQSVTLIELPNQTFRPSEDSKWCSEPVEEVQIP